MEGDIRLIRDLPSPEIHDWRDIERHIDGSRRLRADACRTLFMSACRWTWRTLAPKRGRRTATALLLAAAADAQLEPLAVEARVRRASYLDRSVPLVAPVALLVLFLVAWLG